MLFRELKNRDLHTPEGMLGYTLKDCDEYDGWMALLHDDVTDAEVERGRELYAMFGAPEKCNTVSLTRVNLLERATAFYKVNKRRGMFHLDPTPIEEVLLAMLVSGNFRPGAEWIVPRFGEGANYTRAANLFRLYIDPKSAKLEDLAEVFFIQNINTRMATRHDMPMHQDDPLGAFSRTRGGGDDSDVDVDVHVDPDLQTSPMRSTSSYRHPAHSARQYIYHQISMFGKTTHLPLALRPIHSAALSQALSRPIPRSSLSYHRFKLSDMVLH